MKARVNFACGIGSDIQVKRGDALVLEARAAINPDMGRLSAVELIEQGELVKSTPSDQGSEALTLRHQLPA